MSGSEKHPWLEHLSVLWNREALARRVDPYRGRHDIHAFAVRQLEAFILTVHSVFDDELMRRAASLTYYTLLSLVPLLAVGFALFDAFGGLSKLKQPLKEFIVDTVAVGRQAEIGASLDQFIDNISAGAIAGMGVLVLFYSAVGLLTNIESSFNRVWGIDRDRPLHMRFAIYWCVVTLSPPLLGVSISFSARLQTSAFATSVLEWLPWGMGNLVVVLGSALMVSVAFVLSYVIVPNTKVRLKYAIIGGVLASILWNVTKALYIWLIAGSVKYSAVYGALSALPLLMIWLYLSWIIVLFGVTYTRISQTYTAERMQTAPTLSQTAMEHLAGHVLLEVARAFHRGEGSVTAEVLAHRIGITPALLRPLLRTLTGQRVIIEINQSEEPAYVPGRDIDTLTLADVVTALRQDGDGVLAPCPDPAHERVRELMDRADEAGVELLRHTSLRSCAITRLAAPASDEARPAPAPEPASVPRVAP